MLNTTTKQTSYEAIREKGNYTVTAYIGANDVIHIDVIDNASGKAFRNVMLDLKYNRVFDKNYITEELNIADF